MGVTTIRVVCGERVKGQFGFWVSGYVYGRWVSRQDGHVMLWRNGGLGFPVFEWNSFAIDHPGRAQWADFLSDTGEK